MKKLMLAGVAIAALFSGSAMAADIAVRKALPPPPPVYFSWTGCYVGGHVGGLWANKEWINRNPHANEAEFFGRPEGSHDADGLLGGVQAGCDFQFAGGFVIGIQGDYAWTNAEGSNLSAISASDPLLPQFHNHSTIESLATVTGRIGYAWDRFLGYVKGGAAWERDEYRITESGIIGVIVSTGSETRSGWTIGVGGEYAFTNFLSGFIEYNYYDFGTRQITHDDPLIVKDVEETKSVVRVGLNFRFGGWGKAPVVARY